MTYTATDWLDKNRDTMPPGVMPMLQTSENALLSLIFKGKISRTGTLALHAVTTKRTTRNVSCDRLVSWRDQEKLYMYMYIFCCRQNGSQRKRKSASWRSALSSGLVVFHTLLKSRSSLLSTVMLCFSRLQNSLNVLMERMQASQPVFIRCIKPNERKEAKLFDDKHVNAQVLSNNPSVSVLCYPMLFALKFALMILYFSGVPLSMLTVFGLRCFSCVIETHSSFVCFLQLLYTGMLQTTKIRREGFAVRPSFGEFVQK